MIYEMGYLWKIEKFSEFPQQVGFKVTSPQFDQNGPDGFWATWRIVLFPYGEGEAYKGCVALGLELVRSNYTVVKTDFRIQVRVEKPAFTRTGEENFGKEFAIAAKRMWRFCSYLNLTEVENHQVRSWTEIKVHCHVYNTAARGVQVEKSEPPGSFFMQSWSLYEDQKFTDVSLVVRENEYKVHRFILAARSPVFSAMLEHNFQETIEHKIVITDFGPEVIEEFIKFAYTDKCNFTVTELLVFADKYDVNYLKSECEIALIDGLNSENAAKMLQLADAHGAPHLKSAALNFIKSNVKKVMATEEWNSMTPELLNAIIVSFAENLEISKP